MSFSLIFFFPSRFIFPDISLSSSTSPSTSTSTSTSSPHCTKTSTLFIIFICFCLHFSLSLSSPSSSFKQQPHPVSAPDPSVRRSYFASADSPFTTVLSSNKQFQNALLVIQRHISFVEHQIISYLQNPPVEILTKTTTLSTKRHKFFLQPCVYADSWRFSNGVRILFQNLEMDQPDISCLTQFEGNQISTDLNNKEDNKKAPHSIDEVFNAIVTRASILHLNRHNITKASNLNWPDSDILYRFPYNRSLQRCFIHPVSAIRITSNISQWYIDNRIMNAPMLQYLPRFERKFLSEHIFVDNRNNKNEMKTLNIFNNQTSTVIFDRPMDVSPSNFGTMNIQDNPGLQVSLSMSGLSVQQVQDALTPSNIAILFLPLSFTIIPIAILAPVHTSSMLMYTLFSDVLAIIPLAIKGIELIIIGSQSHRSIVIRLTGAIDGVIADHAGAEIFASECKTNDSVKPIGIRFLSIAVGFMVLGITLEFVALHIRHRRIRRRRILDQLSRSLKIQIQQPIQPDDIDEEENEEDDEDDS